MQTIHIDVKDSYTDKVLTILQSLKGVMLDKIELDKPARTFDDTKELQNLQVDSMDGSWNNEEDKVWDDL